MRPKVDLRQAMAQVAQHVATDMTFRELVAAYCAVQFDGADLRLRKWVDCFGDESAWSITADQVALAAEALRQSGYYRPASINRDTSHIGTIYRWAKQKRMAPRGFVSPTLGVVRYDEAIRRVEISAAEITKLLCGALAHRDRRFAVYVRLLMETGARRGEVRERRWQDVDLDGRSITVLETKTDKPRVLFFSEETAALMRRVWPKRNPEDLLFEGRRKNYPINYRRAWEDLTAAIGRPDLHQHDLRHHRAAELLKAGTTLGVAAQVLGHSSLILQRRYGHLENAALRAATEASWR
ncbi:tyrosine-type recombinase/integrase [Propionivibrio sp.]|uniref:tyrosine-type recombinase/integrase n=1 Tax=Propionivibrio sp. TaxID=2212460 RepID=UPI00272EA456|nr:site-specific integrase [Propionivibrio sp.]